MFLTSLGAELGGGGTHEPWQHAVSPHPRLVRARHITQRLIQQEETLEQKSPKAPVSALHLLCISTAVAAAARYIKGGLHYLWSRAADFSFTANQTQLEGRSRVFTDLTLDTQYPVLAPSK